MLKNALNLIKIVEKGWTKMHWLTLIVGSLFILAGLFVFSVATFGLYKFNYILNRLHVAAKCDTLGALLVLVGLIVFSGLNAMSLKILFIIIFLWLSNPVGSHLIAETEIKSNPVFEEKMSAQESALDDEKGRGLV